MRYDIPNNHEIECKCGCGGKLWALVKYSNCHIAKREYIQFHAGWPSSCWKTKPQVKVRTSRERAMKILRKAGKTICEINNQDCSHKKLESHHIDGDPFNNDISNLVPLCITHHQIVEKRKISIGELKKLQLVYTVSSNKRRYKWRHLEDRTS